MAKADRILDLFPAFYRAADRTKLLADVAQALAQPLEEADTHLFRIQRAHRIKVAEQAGDIVQLSAALNLTAFHFEDILADEDLDYDRKLALMRQRVQRIAGVHLRGLGTPWAVMEAAAIFLNAEIVPDDTNEPPIKHLDAEAFSHRATVEFGHLQGKPRSQIYLHENPLRRNKIEPAERWQLNSWTAESRNVAASPLKLAIKGVADHTVLPSVFCPATGEGIFFNGVVPDGRTLVIDRAEGALLDGQPVDDWLVYFKGGIFDFASSDGAAFVTETARPSPPFDGNLGELVSEPFRAKTPAPMIPPGRSQWYFKVAEGLYDGNLFDFSVFATDGLPVGIYDGDISFDQGVFDYPAAGIAGMAWDERISCSFKLMLPATLPGAEGKAASPANHLSRVANILPRFKAAGIRAYVDAAPDAWVLGESVIRNANATDGEGVQFHSTNLRNMNADILAPLDVQP